MRRSSLCFLLSESKILLAMKKRGFGAGKWNGYGGKQLPNEVIGQTALREMSEEIGVTAQLSDLEFVATLNFYFDQKHEWNQEVSVFICRHWQEDPVETEEMRPQWFALSDIPYDQMWVDDRHWLPKVLAGQKVTGDFYFSEDLKHLKKFKIT
ncbi:MAG TPA: 8-oxo-dGTP diphosphatase [Patescibacteria group bacterium]|nr:8-oxo-dGTP diphosphatase [Patescibacteria group bacterium]